MKTDNINPNRMELMRLKKSLLTAQRGHKMLKDKLNALMRLFMEIHEKSLKIRSEVDQAIKLNMDRWTFVEADLRHESGFYPPVMQEAQHRVIQKEEVIMGIDVLSFQLEKKYKSEFSIDMGLISPEMDQVFTEMSDLLPRLVQLSEIEKKTNQLGNALEKTRRRVNALEHLVVPRIQKQIQMIKHRMEEQDRENTVRLMKVKELIFEKNRKSNPDAV